MVFSAEGISADPLKVSAIKNASSPNSVIDVRGFLGMAAYCSKFIPNFSTLSESLRKLTVKNAKFCWRKREQIAFDNIKSALTSNTVMAYFDQAKQTELITDASPWGLSAILAQKKQQRMTIVGLLLMQVDLYLKSKENIRKRSVKHLRLSGLWNVCKYIYVLESLHYTPIASL